MLSRPQASSEGLEKFAIVGRRFPIVGVCDFPQRVHHPVFAMTNPHATCIDCKTQHAALVASVDAHSSRQE